jgi:hypothetical protein
MTQRPAIPAPPYDGGCICGAARWRLNARPLAINACHCNACKKMTGATNLLMILAHRAAFEHVQGDVQRFRRTAESGRQSDVVRCAVCGTRLWHEPLSAPTLVFVAAGTLDDAGWVVPTSHIWIEKASPGVAMRDDALKMQGQPADRQMLLDAYTAIYGEAS